MLRPLQDQARCPVLHLAQLSSYQSINLPPIQCRYQINTLPPIKLRDESQADKPGVEWQEPDHQQLQPSPHGEASSELLTEEGWRTSAPTRKLGWHQILSSIEPDASAALRFTGPVLATSSPLSTVGPAAPSVSTIHTFSGQKQQFYISPRADGNTRTLARGGRRILTKKSPSLTTDTQQPAVHEISGSLSFSPNEPEYVAKPRPPTFYVVPLMPTPLTQSDGQQYRSPSSSWPSRTDTVHSSGSIIQALVRTPLLQSESSKYFGIFTQSNIYFRHRELPFHVAKSGNHSKLVVRFIRNRCSGQRCSKRGYYHLIIRILCPVLSLKITLFIRATQIT